MASVSNEAPRMRLRRYNTAFKRALVGQTLEPGSSVARIVRGHGINANQLFTWWRQLSSARQTDRAVQSQDKRDLRVPVTLVAEPLTQSLTPSAVTVEGQIECDRLWLFQSTVEQQSRACGGSFAAMG